MLVARRMGFGSRACVRGVVASGRGKSQRATVDSIASLHASTLNFVSWTQLIFDSFALFTSLFSTSGMLARTRGASINQTPRSALEEHGHMHKSLDSRQNFRVQFESHFVFAYFSYQFY